jgi:cell division protein FtsI (penicillin-binding protein 3)
MNNSVRKRLAKREARMGQFVRPNFTARRNVIVVFFAMALVSILAIAFYRQILETDFLSHEGELRFVREREIPARRGLLTDRHGEPLAVSTAVTTFTANPQQLVLSDTACLALAHALQMDPALLAKRLTAHRQRGFMYLRRRLEPDLAAEVNAVIADYHLSGISAETEYRRFYPGGESFSQIIGLTNIDDEGQEGLELIYNERLQAVPGLQRVIQDGKGHVVAEIEQLRAPRHGDDLMLTLDRRLQFLAYRELKRAVLEHQAAAGTAVLLDVQSGEILALVNSPAFNPNAPRTEAAAQRRNRALTDVFEPGSTMKPLIVAMALESNVISPHTPIDTSPGILTIGRNRVRDVHNYGQLDTTSVITKSSNVGVVKIAQRLNASVLWSFYRQFGFSMPTAVKFPGERSGYLPHYSNWSTFGQATLAFGYGLNVTTLQLAQAYTVLAGDGWLRPVKLLRHTSSAAPVQVVSATTAAHVRTMLETVVSAKGTAKRAAIEGYRVGGKTGTAKKAGPHGYQHGRYQAVFAGMAPITNPRFVLVIMIDEPQGRSYYGGLVAAPVFARIMQAALRLYNVPPDAADPSLWLASSDSVRAVP